MATLFHECPVSFLQLGFNLCLCVPRIPCQAGHHHSCSQRLSLVKGPHCCIQLSASTLKEVEEGEMWKNTCTHFSGNAKIGRRAVPQAGNTFPNLRPEEKHFVQEPKWVVVNKTVLLLLFELEPRRFWIVMEVSQQPPVSAFYTTGNVTIPLFSPRYHHSESQYRQGSQLMSVFFCVCFFIRFTFDIMRICVELCVWIGHMQVVTVETGCVRLDGSPSVWVSILAFVNTGVFCFFLICDFGLNDCQ